MTKTSSKPPALSSTHQTQKLAMAHASKPQERAASGLARTAYLPIELAASISTVGAVGSARPARRGYRRVLISEAFTFYYFGRLCLSVYPHEYLLIPVCV